MEFEGVVDEHSTRSKHLLLASGLVLGGCLPLPHTSIAEKLHLVVPHPAYDGARRSSSSTTGPGVRWTTDARVRRSTTGVVVIDETYRQKYGVREFEAGEPPPTREISGVDRQATGEYPDF